MANKGIESRPEQFDALLKGLAAGTKPEALGLQFDLSADRVQVLGRKHKSRVAELKKEMGLAT